MDTVPLAPPVPAPASSPEAQIMAESLDRPFSLSEVSRVVDRLRPRKAPGRDAILNEHIKEARQLRPLWTLLFNKCLEQGALPPQWMECELMAIPKGKGDPKAASSWRGIAKRSCAYKVLSALVTRRLTVLLGVNRVTPPEQHGFVAGRSTMTGLPNTSG